MSGPILEYTPEMGRLAALIGVSAFPINPCPPPRLKRLVVEVRIHFRRLEWQAKR